MRRLRKAEYMLLALCLVVFLISCVTNQDKGLKSFSDMSHKERATWMMGIYNSQARDYKAMVARTDLSNEQKDILRKKKAVMEQVYPMIKTYTTYIDTGAIPTKQVEDEILQLINNLTSLVVPQLEGG